MSTLLKQQAYQLHFYGSGYRILLFSVLASTALVLPTKVDAADVTDVFLGPGAGASVTSCARLKATRPVGRIRCLVSGRGIAHCARLEHAAVRHVHRW